MSNNRLEGPSGSGVTLGHCNHSHKLLMNTSFFVGNSCDTPNELFNEHIMGAQYLYT